MIYIPIVRSEALEDIDNKEVVEGYIDGLKNEPEPKGNRSHSYWHGWCNGMVDGKHAQISDCQRQLARDVIKKGFFK